MCYIFQIYIGNRRGKRPVLENRDILKEIKLGMLVAFESKAEIPKIGEVSHIPPNPTLQSMINVILYKQEGATHKPTWLRNFRITTKKLIGMV